MELGRQRSIIDREIPCVGYGGSGRLFRILTDVAAGARLPTNIATELDKSVTPAYFIEPGDELLIEVLDLESETRVPGDQRVMVDGTIDLGAFGRLQVAGKTLEEIESAVEMRITELTEKQEQINVRLLESNAAVVYVLGEVGSPGYTLFSEGRLFSMLSSEQED